MNPLYGESVLKKLYDDFGEFKILKTYDKIYIEDYEVEYFDVGTIGFRFNRIDGKGFIIIKNNKIVYTSSLMLGLAWRKYIYECVERVMKAELNAQLGI